MKKSLTITIGVVAFLIALVVLAHNFNIATILKMVHGG
jgi:hypothetical protein